MQYIFRTYAESFSPIFPFKILKIVVEKSCAIIENRTELCVEIRCVKICCAWQTKFAWYLKPENRTLSINVAFNFFKFRKYNTAFNSGLKIWLVSGIFEMAQLLNLKFWLYLWRLGVAFSPHFQAAKRCVQHIFRTYAESFSPIFPKEIYWNCYRKFCVIIEKTNRTLSINFVLKIRFRENQLWNQKLKPNFAWKKTLSGNPNFADKLCVEFLSSENIMQHTTAV